MMRIRMILLLVLVAGSAPAANILLNPSFELWIGSLPVGWVTSEPLYPGTAVKDSNAHSGDWCVKLIGGDTSAFMSTATVIRAGYHYEFAGFARVPGVLGGSFVLQFLSLSGGAIGNPTLVPVYYSGPSYREYSNWVTAPDSAALLLVAFATLPGVTAYVDDVTLDDTARVGVEEERPVAMEKPVAPRKLVLSCRVSCPAGPEAVLFDPTGRRAQGVLRPGVYFGLER